ncbi:TPA: hypothetical protein ACH3X1_001754 [Trebouxia sp. C0004]
MRININCASVDPQKVSDPNSVVAQAAQAIIADFDNMMCASDDDVASILTRAFRLGKWRQDQGKPRAVLVELLSVAAKHTAFQASKRLRDLKIRDGALIRKCARGEANKVVAAAAQAARATAPPPPRQQQAQEPRVTVAMDPSALLHQHGMSLDQLSDPSNVVAQASQAIIADFDNMMCASDDDVAS